MVTLAKNLTSKLKLNDGHMMPMFGLGVYANRTADNTVAHALNFGYRLLDTAEFYENEKEVGQGIKKSAVKREDIFVVTKLWTLGYNRCLQAFDASLKKLDIGYVDLYLLHSPQVGKVVESYKAMVELQQKGLIRSIGVSNFGVQHLEGLREAGLPTPTVNQIELHPWMKMKDIVKYCREHGIAVMGYSPLFKGGKFNDPKLLDIAKRLDRTAAEVLIRYSVQMGYITIPKTEKTTRVEENTKALDWEIPQDIMDELNSFPEEACTWTPWKNEWKG